MYISSFTTYFLSIKSDAITFCCYLVCQFVNQHTNLPVTSSLPDGADSVFHISSSLIRMIYDKRLKHMVLLKIDHHLCLHLSVLQYLYCNMDNTCTNCSKSCPKIIHSVSLTLLHSFDWLYNDLIKTGITSARSTALRTRLLFPFSTTASSLSLYHVPRKNSALMS